MNKKIESSYKKKYGLPINTASKYASSKYTYWTYK